MKTNALTLNSPFSYTFPATAGMQHKKFYQFNVPASVFTKLLRMDDNGSTMDRSQRTVSEARAKAFARYLIENIKKGLPFICPTVTGLIDTPANAPEPQFYNAGDLIMEAGVQQVNSSLCYVGALVISMDSIFKLFDGQHRSRGLAIALDMISKSKELSDLCDLSTLTVPLMAYINLTLEERQIFFSDINGNMAKPAASISIAYDHRDPVAKFAVELSQELPFKGLVDFERNTISKKSDYLFPLKTIKDSITALLGLSKNHCEAITPEQKEFVISTFAKFSRSMGWAALEFNGEPAATYRETSILTHTVMTKAIVEAAKAIAAQYGSLEVAPLEKLSGLDYSRQSKDFEDRCINKITGNMVMNKTGIDLAANLIIQTVGCPLSPESKVLEKKYFDIEEAVITEPTPEPEAVESVITEDAVINSGLEEDPATPITAISKHDKSILRSLIVIGAGSNEIMPSVLTRMVNTFEKVAIEYANKHIDKNLSLTTLDAVLKNHLSRINEQQGDEASFDLVRNKKGQCQLFEAVL